MLLRTELLGEREGFVRTPRTPPAYGPVVTPVQKQTGSVDCSAFSIAFAYYAALGENVGRATFVHEEMRQHLMQCFEGGKLEPFLRESKKMHRYKKTFLYFSILYLWTS